MRMSSRGAPALIAVAASCACAHRAVADDGTLSLQLRPRYEFVHQDGKAENARAFTLRTLLGYRVKPADELSGVLQLYDVTTLGPAKYNDTVNGQTQYPAVPDPKLGGVSQAFIDYTGLPATRARLGRQAIAFDNQRFIGPVDWRQAPQTFDAVRVDTTRLPGVRADIAYIGRVNASYANFQAPAGTHLQPVRAGVLHLQSGVVPGAAVSAYDYLYRDRSQPPQAASNLSSNTLGARIDGAWPARAGAKMIPLPNATSTLAGLKPGEMSALYTAEYARQRHAGDGRTDVDARYVHLGLGVATSAFFARVDDERLGANGGGTYGLQTPLATKHTQNGWADMFVVTPAYGLRDRSASVGGAVAGVKLIGVYHDYRSDYASLRYGTEWGLNALHAIDAHLTLGVQFAQYSAKDGRGANFPGTVVPNVDTRRVAAFAVYHY